MVPFAEHESGAWLHGVYRMCTETAAILCGTSKKKIVSHNPSSPFEMLLSVQLHTPCDPQRTHLGNATTATTIQFLVSVQ